jgi:DNA-binding beta-propeller fold protein YncE
MDLSGPCGRVRYFSSNGTFLGEFYTDSSGDIAAGPNGFIYTLDTIGEISEIRYFSFDGFLQGDWFLIPGREARVPRFEFGAVTVGPSGNVYVAEGRQDRISYYSASGSFLGEWGRSGTGPGEFKGPNDIAIAASGTVYVSDSGNGRIQYFTPRGSYLGEWGSKDAADGRFAGLLSIAVTPAGDVLAADIYKKEIEVFSGTGSFISSFSLPGLKDRESYYRDLAVGRDGTVYVSFGDPGYIWAFAPNKGE